MNYYTHIVTNALKNKEMNLLNLSIPELVDKVTELQQKYDSLQAKFAKEFECKEQEKLVLEKLITASKEFLQSTVETPGYHNILKHVFEISGAKYGAFNLFDDNGLDFTTVAVAGINEHIKKALPLLGFNLVNKRWKPDPLRAEKTKQNIITHFASLHDLTGGIIPKSVVYLLEQTFGLGEIVIVKTVKDQKVLGDFTLLFGKGETLLNEKFVDLYAQQVGMLLERNSVTNAFRISEAVHSSLISNISVVTGIIGVDGMIRYKSPNIEKWFGWQPQDLVGTDGWLTVHPGDLDRIRQAFHSLLGKENALTTVEYLYKCKDGSYKPIKLTAANLIHDPVINGVLMNYHDITERKQIETVRQESLDRLRKIASRLPGVVYQYRLRPEGTSCFPFASESIREIYRVNPEEVRDDASKVIANIHPDDLEAVISSVHDSAHDLSPWQHEYRVRFGDGTIRSLYGNAIPEREADGSVLWHGFISDITGRKLAENALKESEAKFRTLFQTSPSGIMVLDENGFILEANEVISKTTRYSYDELIGSHVIKLARPVSPGQVTENIRRILAGEIMEQEAVNIRKDGSSCIFMLRETCITLPDGRRGILSVSNDITERKRTEEEILHKNEELVTLNAEKDKFFSIIAHDLRSPFNAFLGLTELMAEDLHDLTMDDIRSFAVTMRNSATNLYRLLENLLEWSLLQRGVTSFNAESFVLKPKITEFLALYLDAARQKEIEIYHDIPDDLEVLADMHMVETIIRNLVSNAVKFTPRKGKVFISAKPAGHDLAEISVKDTGIGMDRYTIDNIFRLDAHVNRKGTEGERSTGLGLIICKDFIERHNGKLAIESEVNNGSTFYFSLALSKN